MLAVAVDGEDNLGFACRSGRSHGDQGDRGAEVGRVMVKGVLWYATMAAKG